MRYGIDIFSGAGGLSLGAEMAGIRISSAIEINPHAAKTFLRNHKGTKVLQGDIQELEPQTLHDDKKPVFVIMGGPPCQGFSLSNTRTRNMENKKNFLFLEFVRFVKELKPEWFVLENVWGITNINEGKTQDFDVLSNSSGGQVYSTLGVSWRKDGSRGDTGRSAREGDSRGAICRDQRG